MSKIFRTEKAVNDYLQKSAKENPQGKMVFISAEWRRWFNPMRLIYGRVYYKLLNPKK